MISGFQVRYIGSDRTFKVGRRWYGRDEVVRTSFAIGQRAIRRYKGDVVVERFRPGSAPAVTEVAATPTSEEVIRSMAPELEDEQIAAMVEYFDENPSTADVDEVIDFGVEEDVAEALIAALAPESVETDEDEESDGEGEGSEGGEDEGEGDGFSLEDGDGEGEEESTADMIARIAPNLAEDVAVQVVELIDSDAELAEADLTAFNGIGAATAKKILAELTTEE